MKDNVTKKMYKRIISCDRKGLQAFFINEMDADVAFVSVSNHGIVISSNRPADWPIFKWLYEVVKVLRISQRIFCEENISD